jgi:uncharacterized protein YrzB (UPF0473 family)
MTEPSTEKVNNDLVEKLMSELDTEAIQTDPVFEIEENVKPVEEIQIEEVVKKKKKKTKKPVVVLSDSEDEDEEEEIVKYKKPKKERIVEYTEPSPISFEENFKKVIDILKKTLILAIIFFFFLAFKNKFADFINQKIPTISLVDIESNELNYVGIFIFTLLFAVSVFSIKFYETRN